MTRINVFHWYHTLIGTFHKKFCGKSSGWVFWKTAWEKQEGVKINPFSFIAHRTMEAVTKLCCCPGRYIHWNRYYCNGWCFSGKTMIFTHKYLPLLTAVESLYPDWWTNTIPTWLQCQCSRNLAQLSLPSLLHLCIIPNFCCDASKNSTPIGNQAAENSFAQWSLDQKKLFTPS